MKSSFRSAWWLASLSVNLASTALPAASTVLPETLPWQLSAGDFVRSGVALGPDGELYFGDMKGGFYAVDSDSQQLLWSTSLRGAIATPPVVHVDGSVIVTTDAGIVYALDAGDGMEKWSFSTGAKIQTAPLDTLDGRLFVGDSKGILYSLDGETGRLRWTYDSRSGHYGAITGSPVMDRAGRLYFIQSTGNTATLMALETESRKLLWSYSAPGDGWAGPILNNEGDVLFGTDSRQMHCVASDGTPRWSSSVDGAIKGTPVVDSLDNVYIGTLGNSVYSFDTDGHLNWSARVKGDVQGALVVTSSQDVLVADQGRVHRITADGKDEILYDTRSTHLIRSPLNLSLDGWLYFGSDDKKLHAVPLDDLPDTESCWPSARADLRGSGQVFPNESGVALLAYGARNPDPGCVVASRVGDALSVECSTDLKVWQAFDEAWSANGVRFLPDPDSIHPGNRFFRLSNSNFDPSAQPKSNSPSSRQANPQPR